MNRLTVILWCILIGVLAFGGYFFAMLAGCLAIMGAINYFKPEWVDKIFGKE